MNHKWSLKIRWEFGSFTTLTDEIYICDSFQDCEDELKHSWKKLASFGYSVISAFAFSPNGERTKLYPFGLTKEPI